MKKTTIFLLAGLWALSGCAPGGPGAQEQLRRALQASDEVIVHCDGSHGIVEYGKPVKSLPGRPWYSDQATYTVEIPGPGPEPVRLEHSGGAFMLKTADGSEPIGEAEAIEEMERWNRWQSCGHRILQTAELIAMDGGIPDSLSELEGAPEHLAIRKVEMGFEIYCPDPTHGHKDSPAHYQKGYPRYVPGGLSMRGAGIKDE